MTVEIDFGRSYLNRNIGKATVYLIEPETDSDYHSFSAYTDAYDGNRVDPHWTWENPDADLLDITLSPSIAHWGSIGPDFHIYIRNGEIEHLGDCECGCD